MNPCSGWASILTQQKGISSFREWYRRRIMHYKTQQASARHDRACKAAANLGSHVWRRCVAYKSSNKLCKSCKMFLLPMCSSRKVKRVQIRWHQCRLHSLLDGCRPCRAFNPGPAAMWVIARCAGGQWADRDTCTNTYTRPTHMTTHHVSEQLPCPAQSMAIGHSCACSREQRC
jgi:hypothetical protein